MMAEKHRANKEMGELQHAVIRNTFKRLRDGDRFFYTNVHESEKLMRIREETDAKVTHNYTLADILRLHGISPVDQDGVYDKDIWRVGSTSAGRNARYGLIAPEDQGNIGDGAGGNGTLLAKRRPAAELRASGLRSNDDAISGARDVSSFRTTSRSKSEDDTS